MKQTRSEGSPARRPELKSVPREGELWTCPKCTRRTPLCGLPSPFGDDNPTVGRAINAVAVTRKLTDLDCRVLEREGIPALVALVERRSQSCPVEDGVRFDRDFDRVLLTAIPHIETSAGSTGSLPRRCLERSAR